MKNLIQTLCIWFSKSSGPNKIQYNISSWESVFLVIFLLDETGYGEISVGQLRTSDYSACCLHWGHLLMCFIVLIQTQTTPFPCLLTGRSHSECSLDILWVHANFRVNSLKIKVNWNYQKKSLTLMKLILEIVISRWYFWNVISWTALPGVKVEQLHIQNVLKVTFRSHYAYSPIIAAVTSSTNTKVKLVLKHTKFTANWQIV